jgi:hypothetical protein
MQHPPWQKSTLKKKRPSEIHNRQSAGRIDPLAMFASIALLASSATPYAWLLGRRIVMHSGSAKMGPAIQAGIFFNFSNYFQLVVTIKGHLPGDAGSSRMVYIHQTDG